MPTQPVSDLRVGLTTLDAGTDLFTFRERQRPRPMSTFTKHRHTIAVPIQPTAQRRHRDPRQRCSDLMRFTTSNREQRHRNHRTRNPRTTHSTHLQPPKPQELSRSPLETKHCVGRRRSHKPGPGGLCERRCSRWGPSLAQTQIELDTGRRSPCPCGSGTGATESRFYAPATGWLFCHALARAA